MNRRFHLLEEKKCRVAHRQPRYGMRKLSIGLVSCALGYAIFCCPTDVWAQTATTEIHTTTIETTPTDANTHTLPQLTKTLETSTTPEASKSNKEPSTLIDVDDSMNVPEETLKATSTSALQSEDMTDLSMAIGGANIKDATTIRPAYYDGESLSDDTALKAEVDFKISKAVTSKDFFDLQVSRNVNYHGSAKSALLIPIEYEGKVIATPTLLEDGRTIRYVFNNHVDALENIHLKIALPLFVDKEHVPNNSRERVRLTVGGKSIEREYTVDYTSQDHLIYDDGYVSLSGDSDVSEITESSYLHTIHINPANQEITGSRLSIYEYLNRDNKRHLLFDQEVLDTVKVYRVKDGEKPNGSFFLDKNKVDDITSQITKTLRDSFEKGRHLGIDINQNRDEAAYIVSYRGKKLQDAPNIIATNLGAQARFGKEGALEGSDTTPDSGRPIYNVIIATGSSTDASANKRVPKEEKITEPKPIEASLVEEKSPKSQVADMINKSKQPQVAEIVKIGEPQKSIPQKKGTPLLPTPPVTQSEEMPISITKEKNSRPPVVEKEDIVPTGDKEDLELTEQLLKEKTSSVFEEQKVSKTKAKIAKTPQQLKIQQSKEAPKTFDGGIAHFVGLASVSSALLAYVEIKKKKRKKIKGYLLKQ